MNTMPYKNGEQRLKKQNDGCQFGKQLKEVMFLLHSGAGACYRRHRHQCYHRTLPLKTICPETSTMILQTNPTDYKRNY